mmetsp:Transcript_1065/g.2840  ORF Transcript_1065/g.2840 Transcript_1065/m.2840 type:complete len:213 (-) Transcript_1065:201-839(-)
MAIEQARVEPGIRMDRDRPAGSVAGRHQAQLAALGGGVEMLLLIARRDAAQGGVGLDPDLQEMRGPVLGVIELAVLNAGAGAHALHITGADDAAVGRALLAVAHAVLVRQFTVEHIADDLHVAVAMGAEAGTRGDPVFIDHAQRAEAHAGRVVVVGKREAVEGFQPAVIGIAAVAGPDQLRGHVGSGPDGDGNNVGAAAAITSQPALSTPFK